LGVGTAVLGSAHPQRRIGLFGLLLTHHPPLAEDCPQVGDARATRWLVGLSGRYWLPMMSAAWTTMVSPST
jgi:hypothetical protein